MNVGTMQKFLMTVSNHLLVDHLVLKKSLHVKLRMAKDMRKSQSGDPICVYPLLGCLKSRLVKSFHQLVDVCGGTSLIKKYSTQGEKYK